ncbi:hypothetical protein FLAN108750_11295 [Flavobacterium antarcticum]
MTIQLDERLIIPTLLVDADSTRFIIVFGFRECFAVHKKTSPVFIQTDLFHNFYN